jgi:outer membrane protein assembly factor BamD
MRVTKLPAFKVFVVLAIALSMNACSMFHHKRETNDTLPVDKLYAKAPTTRQPRKRTSD